MNLAMESERTDDDDIRMLAEAGRLSEAATAVLERHGPGVLGYLHAIAASASESEELFSEVCERLWTRLPTFAWTGSIRTWMYVTARNLLVDTRRKQKRRPAVPLSRAPELAAVVRTSTAVYRKTNVKDALSRLRAELDPEDRTLLILRVDRQMAWQDVAEVIAGPEASADDRKRAAARLRKRFERLKDRIRAALESSPDE